MPSSNIGCSYIAHICRGRGPELSCDRREPSYVHVDLGRTGPGQPTDNLSEQSRLLAEVICGLSGPSPSKIDMDIAWLTTIATQFRSAAAAYMSNIRAADIARRHGKVDNFVHFGNSRQSEREAALRRAGWTERPKSSSNVSFDPHQSGPVA